ncbi:MAG: glycosyltransferase [Chitinophagaceae bacterium]|nr:glycosyltransferase [Chitinophagaceae bacterium]
MGNNDKKIGYVPYSADLSQPGDRRRFPYFAGRHNIPFEIADPGKEYETLVLTGSSNLSLWLKYKKKYPGVKVIFEMVDNLIFAPDWYFRMFKGVGRYLNRREKALHLNYSKLVMDWIGLADVVLCSNNVLKEKAKEINPKSFLSPDYLESEYSLRKDDYQLKEEKLNLVWEGLSSLIWPFFEYADLLKEASSFCRLYILSNEKYPAIPGLYHKDVKSRVQQLPIEVTFYPWDLKTHTQIMTKADCAIIPISRKSTFMWNKPGNKLVSFWFLGMPAVTSATPAYQELMQGAGLDYCASDTGDWLEKLRALHAMKPEERKAIAEKGYAFVKENFSDVRLDEIWIKAFDTIGRSVLLTKS